MKENFKQQLRNRLKEIRDGLTLKRREEASQLACRRVAEWFKEAAFVLSFASFQSEINLCPLNQELAGEGRLVLPRLINQNLQLYCVKEMGHLEAHSWGFLEPRLSDCLPVDISQIEIALIPGLGFDLNTKHRLGYGGGYYDKLLASAETLETIGIGFCEQAVENLPYSEKDIPLKQIHLF